MTGTSGGVRDGAGVHDPVAVFEMAVGLVPVHAYVKDRHGRYRFINDQYRTTVLDHAYGPRPAGAYLGRHNRDLGTWDERHDRVEELERRVFDDGLPLCSNESYPLIGGGTGYARGVRFLLPGARESLLVGLFVDCTDAVRALRRVRALAQRCAAIAELGGAGLATLDERGAVVTANTAAARLAQRPAAELAGLPLFVMLHPSVVGGVAQREAEFARTTQTRYEMPVALRGLRGQPVAGTLIRVKVPPADDGVVSIVVMDPAGDAVPTPCLSDVVDRGDGVDRTILTLLATGFTISRIAGQLHMSAKAVERRVGKLRATLRADNATALVARAYATGLLRPGTWPPAAGDTVEDKAPLARSDSA